MAAVMQSPADSNVLTEQVASVEESAVGVAGQENECVVTV